MFLENLNLFFWKSPCAYKPKRQHGKKGFEVRIAMQAI